MRETLNNIQKCTLCKDQLPHGVNPILSASLESKIVIIGQAPGRIVHETNIPWNDKSGDNLRAWMDVSKDDFYNTSKFAIIPMGFCYPGTGKSGDLPPMKICATEWHNTLLMKMDKVELILLVGKYAQDYYLNLPKKTTLTNTVKNYKSFLPKFLPLPHPSPRNNIWKAKNRWFEKEVIPELQSIIHSIF